MSETFCPIPWNFQAIRNNGDIRICCQANITPNKGVVRHEDGTPFNAARDSLEEARNASLMKDVRKNMLAGKWSEECKRCKDEEAAGLNSRRTYELSNWPNDTVESILPITSEDGTIDTTQLPIKYYDLRFGNMCNLACRMCGPEDSHTWYEQWSKFTKTESFVDTHGIVKLIRNSVGRLTTTDYDWHSSEAFWDQISANIGNIQQVYMAGGEPLLIERHYEFLDKCISADAAKNIVLEYNTNGTLLPARVVEMWKHFKQVRIGVSIDGIGKVVEYQRWPAKWSQLKSNLEKLNALVDNNPNIDVWLAVTVTAYNVMHIADMIEWKIFESNLPNINRYLPLMTPHIAHRPETTNIKLLPAEYKLLVEQRFAKSIDLLKDTQHVSRATKIYNGIIKYMNSEDWYNRFFDDFEELTNFLDIERNQNIFEITPELKPWFKHRGNV
jgi:sulfatase maturation enzyme AslB (radical SAM superfamily)